MSKLITKPYGKVYALLKTKEQIENKNFFQKCEYFRFSQHGANIRVKEINESNQCFQHSKKTLKIKYSNVIHQVVVVGHSFKLSMFKGIPIYDNLEAANQDFRNVIKQYPNSNLLTLPVVTNMTLAEQEIIEKSLEHKVFEIRIADGWGGESVRYIKATKKDIRTWLNNHYYEKNTLSEYEGDEATIDNISFNPTATYFEVFGNDTKKPFILKITVSIKEIDISNINESIYRVVSPFLHVEEELAQHGTLDESMDFLQQYIDAQKKMFNLLSNEELIEEGITQKQGEIVLIDSHYTNRYMANLFYVEKTSYEYDEYSISSHSAIIKEHKIESLEMHEY